MATYEQIVEANRATFAAWNAHDPAAVAAIYAAQEVVRDVGTPGVWDLGPLAQLDRAP